MRSRSDSSVQLSTVVRSHVARRSHEDPVLVPRIPCWWWFSRVFGRCRCASPEVCWWRTASRRKWFRCTKWCSSGTDSCSSGGPWAANPPSYTYDFNYKSKWLHRASLGAGTKENTGNGLDRNWIKSMMLISTRGWQRDGRNNKMLFRWKVESETSACG